MSLRSSKSRNYFTQAFLFLVLLCKEGTNWKISVPHSCTSIAVWAMLAHSSVSLWHAATPLAQLWGDSSGTRTPGKPECSSCFALKCMQGHTSPLSLHLGWPPSISSVLAAMSTSQHQGNKTSQSPLQTGLECSYFKSQGTPDSATHKRRFGVLGMA